ncbi:hypothetical protein A3Q56_07038 [Intoshia linei]|uniref:Uncharacterized protein n=1 Tax=Intoshia linei TaxID=1819745 RepID=A0A177AT69_9BILA|nr:hypothetical protein A3Q56_07038 [Intoshia linei]
MKSDECNPYRLDKEASERIIKNSLSKKKITQSNKLEPFKYIKNSKFQYLHIYPDNTIGFRNVCSNYAKLNIIQNFIYDNINNSTSEMIIQGIQTNNYICLNEFQDIYTSKNISEECKFQVKQNIGEITFTLYKMKKTYEKQIIVKMKKETKNIHRKIIYKRKNTLIAFDEHFTFLMINDCMIKSTIPYNKPTSPKIKKSNSLMEIPKIKPTKKREIYCQVKKGSKFLSLCKPRKIQKIWKDI